DDDDDDDEDENGKDSSESGRKNQPRITSDNTLPKLFAYLILFTLAITAPSYLSISSEESEDE
ncbi:MAG TPA: hypothetical protein D7H74_04600, partial [Candidatus Poseidoniales archaeon]